MTAGADGATPTRGRLGAGVAGVAEALCPLLLLAILLDATSRVEWVFLQRDPAIYASIARYWEAGLMPYRDVWEFKPPLIFVALRAGFALWGHEPESLRRVFLILTWIGSLALYLGLRRARCLIAAPVAALGLMTLVVVNPWELPWQNTEPLVAAFAAAAIGCATAHQRDARWWWALLTGACLGLAVTGKQPAALFAVPLGLQLCLWGAPDGWRGRVTYVGHRALLGLGGFALALAPFALYFALHDALRALYDAVLVDGAAYSQSVGLSWIRPSVLALRTPPGVRNLFAARPAFPFVALGLMWPFVAAIGGLAVLTLLRPSRWVLVAWAWLVAAAFAVWIGPFAENHYLVMTLPALALTAGIVAEQCWPTARAFGWRTRTVRLLAGILIAALLYGRRLAGSVLAAAGTRTRRRADRAGGAPPRRGHPRRRPARRPPLRRRRAAADLLLRRRSPRLALHLLERAQSQRHRRAGRGGRTRADLLLPAPRRRGAAGGNAGRAPRRARPPGTALRAVADVAGGHRLSPPGRRPSGHGRSPRIVSSTISAGANRRSGGPQKPVPRLT